jgi:hypothetical protein
MKKTSKQLWFLKAGLAALVLGLALRLFAPSQGNAMHFVEGACSGLSLVLLIACVSCLRASSQRKHV